mmetsp:Transcript_33421/g.78836  ORF Transcript_33421/g.78836 Transcript_33421/m.78836 type:complete len:243 (+) Transcript_33421:1664-2392(+)
MGEPYLGGRRSKVADADVHLVRGALRIHLHLLLLRPPPHRPRGGLHRRGGRVPAGGAVVHRADAVLDGRGLGGAAVAARGDRVGGDRDRAPGARGHALLRRRHCRHHHLRHRRRQRRRLGERDPDLLREADGVPRHEGALRVDLGDARAVGQPAQHPHHHHHNRALLHLPKPGGLRGGEPGDGLLVQHHHARPPRPGAKAVCERLAAGEGERGHGDVQGVQPGGGQGGGRSGRDQAWRGRHA